MNRNNDLTEGVIWKKLLIFALPIIAGNIFHQLYNAVDAIVVSKYVGTEALASVGGSAANIMNLVIGFFMALSSGATIVLAQQYGAKNYEAVSKAAHTAVIFCVIAGLGTSAVCIPFAPSMLHVLKAPAETIPGATLYLRIIFTGAFFTLMFNMGSGILRAVGDSRRPFIYLCVSCLTNIALDLLFVIFFKLGVAGVAIATVMSQALCTVLVLIRLFTTDESYKLSFKNMRFDRLMFRNMMRIGIPSGIQGSMYSISNTIIMVGVNTLGTVVVASWSMSGKIDGIYWATSNAFGVALMNFVAQNYGAGRIDRVKSSVKLGIKLFGGITIVLSGVIMFVARYLLPVFTNDPAVISTTYQIITYFVPPYITWTLVEVFSSVLKGAGDAMSPAIIQLFGVCLLRVVWVYTIFRIWPTLFAIAMCYPASWIATDIAMYIRYRSGKWNKHQLAETENAV